MEIIAHRINRISELKKLPLRYGAEIDVRTNGSKIILNHDPYKNGENFKNYLENYNNGTLVLNIKEAGIEKEVVNITKKFRVKKKPSHGGLFLKYIKILIRMIFQ